MNELVISTSKILVEIEFLFSSHRGSTKKITILGNSLVDSATFNTVAAEFLQLVKYNAASCTAINIDELANNFSQCIDIDQLQLNK